MVERNMKVKVIYRNYIPLYTGYCSFWLIKIPGIQIFIPPPNTKLKTLFKIYRKLKFLSITRFITELLPKFIFPAEQEKEAFDLYFFTGILPGKGIRTPFAVDFEHIYALFNFGTVNKTSKKRVFDILVSPACRKILPWSEAARLTLKRLYTDQYGDIAQKTEVLYPALPVYYDKYYRQRDHSLVKNNGNLKLLFIGKDHKRKGLLEVLEAIKILLEKHDDIEFYCISDISRRNSSKYSHPAIRFYPCCFSHDEVVRKLMLTCDLFVLPTHEDTFGMVLLEALASGLPVITTNQFATRELIADGGNGFFVESDILYLEKRLIPDKNDNGSVYSGIERKLVLSIISTIEHILESREILEQMKQHCLREFQPGGKFSLETRNAALERIFREAALDE